MAFPPPPFANITGTTAIIGKYNQQENIANADGNARPGQLVIDLEVDPPQVYVGNNLGNLSLISSGGTANISVSDEGSLLTAAVQSFNFVGTGVTATVVGNAVTVTVPTVGATGATGATGPAGATGAGITAINPTALSNTVHIAATVSGNTANIITDATTANTANTIVVRDANGAINVNGWTVGTHLTAVNYTATNSDYWIGTTTKSKTITLPNASNGASTGRQYQIADTVHNGNPGTTIAAQSPATVVGNQPSQQGQIIIATYVDTTWYLN